MRDGEREVLGLMLLTNAEVVAGVLRGTDGSESYSPLAALAATRTLALVIEDTMRALANQTRSAGVTWQEIGDVLGTTRQAAYQRFGPYINEEKNTMEPTLSDAADRGRAAFEKYTQQDWSLRDDFDQKMSDACSVELLASGWQQITSAFGAFTGFGEPTVRVVQGITIVDVPMRFASGDMKGRAAYDDAGKIAGFFILDPAAV